MSERCRVYWRTHGCDLPRGHAGPHTCHPVEFMHHEDDDWHLCENDPPAYRRFAVRGRRPGWVGRQTMSWKHMPLGGVRYRLKKRFHSHDAPLAMGMLLGKRIFMCSCGVIWDEDELMDESRT